MGEVGGMDEVGEVWTGAGTDNMTVLWCDRDGDEFVSGYLCGGPGYNSDSTGDAEDFGKFSRVWFNSEMLCGRLSVVWVSGEWCGVFGDTSKPVWCISSLRWHV